MRSPIRVGQESHLSESRQLLTWSMLPVPSTLCSRARGCSLCAHPRSARAPPDFSARPARPRLSLCVAQEPRVTFFTGYQCQRGPLAGSEAAGSGLKWTINRRPFSVYSTRALQQGDCCWRYSRSLGVCFWGLSYRFKEFTKLRVSRPKRRRLLPTRSVDKVELGSDRS